MCVHMVHTWCTPCVHTMCAPHGAHHVCTMCVPCDMVHTWCTCVLTIITACPVPLAMVLVGHRRALRTPAVVMVMMPCVLRACASHSMQAVTVLLGRLEGIKQRSILP